MRRWRRSCWVKPAGNLARVTALSNTRRCEYPDAESAPTVVLFSPARSYGFLTVRDAHDWFLEMMGDHEEFEVETDRVGEPPVPFWSETVRWVVVE